MTTREWVELERRINYLILLCMILLFLLAPAPFGCGGH